MKNSQKSLLQHMPFSIQNPTIFSRFNQKHRIHMFFITKTHCCMRNKKTQTSFNIITCQLNNNTNYYMENTLSQQVQLSTFTSQKQLTWITEVLRAELAEPYSVFTYYYFIKNWPELTVMAYLDNTPIGCIIGSYDKDNPRKAYIAMLVVLQEYRRHRVGRKLFDEFVKRVEGKVDKIVLETQCINKAALNFYLKLGFFKTRKMSNYYLSGNDAFRLKLYLRKKQPLTSEDESKEKAVQEQKAEK